MMISWMYFSQGRHHRQRLVCCDANTNNYLQVLSTA